MKHFSSIKTTREFNRVYKDSKAVHTSQFVLFYQAHSEEYKIGIVASKKVGNAVSRNRAKRLLRAHFINHIDKLETGYYVLVAKPSILDSDYHKLAKVFFNAFKRLNAIKQ
ncbi:MAG: ribonuclease P protein component [Epsilonproteobacteria bacterium]|nr:ribonuclease P protein component [Campylobacterota bacterium]